MSCEHRPTHVVSDSLVTSTFSCHFEPCSLVKSIEKPQWINTGLLMTEIVMSTVCLHHLWIVTQAILSA